MKHSLRSWLWRVDVTQEVDEEIAFHVEMRTRELVERGVDPRVAREMALARVGDVSQLRRTCVDLGRRREREMRLTQWLEELRDDGGFAVRQLKASPGFAFVAAITLALGIGANGAIFALVDAALLRPLPLPEPGRLAIVWERSDSVLVLGVLFGLAPAWHAREVGSSAQGMSGDIRTGGCDVSAAAAIDCAARSPGHVVGALPEWISHTDDAALSLGVSSSPHAVLRVRSSRLQPISWRHR